MNTMRLQAWVIYGLGLAIVAVLPHALPTRWAVLGACIIGFLLGITMPLRWGR